MRSGQSLPQLLRLCAWGLDIVAFVGLKQELIMQIPISAWWHIIYNLCMLLHRIQRQS